ncbi:hypothetical protein AVEN_26857-1 [Araneus ventricosus]|uniref:Uncharacterized protein n=1 Tax=Araneus ventricosus TaxID=182803 RepID=A0A4Y2UNB5_ARAVE|nr:hypothetical protein AVEN_26857-1 [Araneus ventricosus]
MSCTQSLLSNRTGTFWNVSPQIPSFPPRSIICADLGYDSLAKEINAVSSNLNKAESISFARNVHKSIEKQFRKLDSSVLSSFGLIASAVVFLV